MNRRWFAAAALLVLAASAQGQYVEDSLDVGGAAVGSLAYNSTAGVVYGCSEGTNYFFAISCDSHKVISRIYRDSPIYIAYASRVNKAYFTQRTDDIDSVIVVDGTTHRYLKAIPLLWATVPVYDSVSNRLYVSRDEENEVSVIDCVTDSVLARIHVGSGPVWMDLNAHGRRLYTRNYDGESVSIIDLETNTVIRTIRLGGVPSSGCFCQAVNKYYCGADDIYVICGVGDTLIERIPTGVGVYVPAMVAVETHSLVMAGSGTGQAESVLVIDALGDTIVRALPAPRLTGGLLWSEATDLVYCARGGCDSVTVVRGTGDRVASVIPVGVWPSRLAFAPEYGRMYVGHTNGRFVYVLRDTVTGIAEEAPGATLEPVVRATVVRGAGWANLGEPGILIDAAGRRVAEIGPGRARPRLAPGVYFIGEGFGARGLGRIRKVVVLN